MNTATDKDKLNKSERKNIEELFKDFNGEYEPTEIDWGEPQGNEVI